MIIAKKDKKNEVTNLDLQLIDDLGKEDLYEGGETRRIRDETCS